MLDRGTTPDGGLSKLSLPRGSAVAAALGLAVWAAASAPLASAERAGDETPPLTLRVAWGGGREVAWSGLIRVVEDGVSEEQLAGGESAAATESPAAASLVAVRSLCPEADPAEGLRREPGGVRFDSGRRRGFDGFDLTLSDWHDKALVVELVGRGDGKRVRLVERIADLAVTGSQQALDSHGNRLSVNRSPGDWMAARLADGRPLGSTVHQAGGTLQLEVGAMLPERADAASGLEMTLSLVASGSDEPIVTRRLQMEPAGELATASDGRVLRGFGPLRLPLKLPQDEGAYDLRCEVVETGSLRWARSVAERTIQLVTVAATPRRRSAADESSSWELVYEFDPGNPRLFDRLRRLPGLSGSVPSISVPSVDSLSRLSGVNRLPGFSGERPRRPVLPSGGPAARRGLDAFMPRFSGPLPSGHGELASHAIGPAMRLPASPQVGEPLWEAIVVPVAEPGRPHLIEVDYPQDRDASVAVCVIEPNASGVVPRRLWGGGYDSRADAYGPADAPPRVGRYRQVFWPRTKTPLVVLANLSREEEAVVTRLRVRAGPESLPPRELVESPLAAEARKGYEAYLDSPDFARFGSSGEIDEASGTALTGWAGLLDGARRLAELTRHRGADAAVVTIYKGGTPAWPSAPGGLLWDNGRLSQAGRDSEAKDVVGLLCRVLTREGLGFVPAVECAGPLPQLEAVLARGGVDAEGIECIGADGRPVSGEGRVRYNPLDPRVQQALEDLIAELAGRLRGERAVRAVVLECPHDGWFHLPGIAAPLDDSTIRRFVEETGIEMPMQGQERFARRAALVAGPFREPWLEWRAGQIAAVCRRLADRMAAAGLAADLRIAPTTLLSEGSLAARFQPRLVPEETPAGPLEAAGLNPAMMTADPRVVFVVPKLHEGGGGLVEASSVQAANASVEVMQATSKARRRGGLLVGRPREIDLAAVVAASPLAAGGSGTGVKAVVATRATGIDAHRCLATSLVAADVETISDGDLMVGEPPDDANPLRALQQLPKLPMETVESLPAPLVVRTADGPRGLLVQLVNASPTPCVAAVRLSDEGGSPRELPLGPWDVQAMTAARGARVESVDAIFGEQLRGQVAARLEGLRRRRSVLETPLPLEVLDNPDFELPVIEGTISGWELVEEARGTLEPTAGHGGTAGVRFASEHGLSTLRSNPFPPPRTGRLSVAVWLRIDSDQPQPPLRIAVEGLRGRRQYYRYAPVGRGSGAMPLKPAWAQMVLQVDQLPADEVESLRVRLDLLGPGSVCLDDVRVFDLAFDESQRVQLSKMLALIDNHLVAGRVGAAVLELDGHWPHFLEAHISDKAIAVAEQTQIRQRARAEAEAEAESQPAARTGMLERLRQFWQ